MLSIDFFTDLRCASAIHDRWQVTARCSLQFFRYETAWYEKSLKMRRARRIMADNSPWLSLTNATFLNTQRVSYSQLDTGLMFCCLARWMRNAAMLLI